MHKKTVRFLSVFLSAAMMMGTVSVPALAEETPSAYEETVESAAEAEQAAALEEAEEAASAEEAAEGEAEEAAEAGEETEADPGAAEEAAEETEETETADTAEVEEEEDTESPDAPAEETDAAAAAEAEEAETAEADPAEEAAQSADEEAAEEAEEVYSGGEDAAEEAGPVETVEESPEAAEDVTTDAVMDEAVETPEIPLTGAGYVLMNIPYAEFYAAEGTDAVDAVSSSTKSKTLNGRLAGGSYHVNADGSDISGIIYPVFVSDLSVLEGLTRITDESSVDVTMTNHGNTSTTTYSGKDALFEAPDHAYYVLSGEPAYSKTLTVGADGTFSFGAVSGEAVTVQGVTGEVKYAGRHTDIEIPLDGTEGISQGDQVSAVVLTDADGNKYGMRHVYNIWRATELGWNDDELNLYGKTITNIRYITPDEVIDYPVEIALKKQLSDVEAAFDGLEKIVLTGLPEDIENPKATVSSAVGRGETPVVIADGAAVENGAIATTEAAVAGTNYNVKIVSDNYADVSKTVKAMAKKEMSLLSIGGVNYYYADTAGDDTENTAYCFSVTTGRGANAVTTNYSYGIADLTQVTGTDYYYIAAPGAAALEGTLYGYGSGTASSYKEVYGKLGVSTDTDPAYDAVSSATGFSGHHAKDIPSLVTFTTDKDGEKTITGLMLGREGKTVDAVSYVEASILQAAGQTLAQEQKKALDITLKINPMSAPSEKEIPVQVSSAALTTSRYGLAEFALVPDDTVEGYVWSEYWGSVYGATISDGKNSAGAVHWIDLYGVAAVSGPHYNKIEIALNKGESEGSNKAEVSRYDAFFDGGYIKSGTYTITVYAEGYAPLTAQVAAEVKLSDKTTDYTGQEVSIDEAELTGIEGDVVYTCYEDEECTKAMASLPVEAGTYYVKAVAADLVISEAAKLTINAPEIPATAIKLNKKKADIAATKTLQLKADFTPDNATDQTLTWTSSDTSVATVDRNGKVKAKKYGTATITAKTANGLSAACEVRVLFADVSNSGKSYFQPVYWAVDKGITVCSVNFRPEDSVTRGEFVAFLWRLAGKPKSGAKVSFKDVNSKTKFYDAIRWAVGTGIIKGYGDKTFKPDNNVTRGETATMIWRYAGKPAPKTKKSPFSDIKVTSADSCRAILWGAENSIIKGSGGKFLKNDGCTRGQVVTFLYRYSNK